MVNPISSLFLNLRAGFVFLKGGMSLCGVVCVKEHVSLGLKNILLQNNWKLILGMVLANNLSDTIFSWRVCNPTINM